MAVQNELTDVEDRFDTLVDANDQMLERIVSIVILQIPFLGCFKCHSTEC